MQWFRDIQEGKTECTIYPLAILTQHQYNGKEVFYLYNGACYIYKDRDTKN